MVYLVLVMNADPRLLLSYPAVVVFDAFGAMVWTVIVVVLLVAVSLALALPTSGPVCVRPLLRPVWRLAFLAALVAVLLLSGLLWYDDGRIGSLPVALDVSRGITWGAIGSFLGAALLQLWILVMLMACVYLAAKHVLTVADAHPTLPPIATIAVTWTLALGGVVTEVTGEVALLFPAAPAFVPATPGAQAVTWTSLAVLTCVCVLQLREACASWSLRHGPWS